jgi:hyperosmotically inducible protein
MRRILQVGTIAVALSIGATGLATAQVKDGWLTAKTKIILMTTADLRTSSLNVDTVDGVVTLHGKVPTAAQRDRAEQLAKDVDGVKAVKNLLQVVPVAQEDAVDANDEALKDQVERALKANQAVAKSGIHVSSVNKGVVLISGKTDNIVTHLQAIEAAYMVKGVRRVSTDVKVEERS